MRKMVYEIDGIETIDYYEAEALAKLMRKNYKIKLVEIKPEENLKKEDREKLEKDRAERREKRLKAIAKRLRAV